MAFKRTPRDRRLVRHLRVRHSVIGTTQRPRLAVFRSLKHVYAQIIDDENHQTLAAASSRESEIFERRTGLAKVHLAQEVGALVATRATEKGFREVVFDRGGYKYHGRVRAVATGAREGGLLF